MRKKNLNSILVLGALAILGIIVLQVYWLAMTWKVKNNEFYERVNISLRKVAEKMAEKSEIDLPKKGLIKQLPSNDFLVNYNDVIEPDILEDLLIRELDIIDPNIKFEYAVYDCHSNDLIYGNCCMEDGKDKEKLFKKLPDIDKYTYYFIVRFPDKKLFLLYDLKLFMLLGLFAIIAIFAYLYAIKSIYRQRKLSELQKDFVDNMTHEFKTPLTSIKLASHVIGSSDEVSSNPRLKKYSGIITQQSEKLTSHIERMLDLIRSDEKFKLKFEEINLKEFINNILISMEHNLMHQNVEVDFKTEKDDLVIIVDKYHFSNVIYNIIENGIKYNKKENKKIRIRLQESETNYSLSIKDNGIGISKDNLSNIFKKFFRVQKGNIHDVKGFGLGLYYVKNIISLHEWNISVNSKEKVGTTFTIIINKNKKNGEQS